MILKRFQATEDTLEWEKAFLKSAKESSDELELEESLKKSSLAVWYESARSFGDISSSTMFQDFGKIAAGFILMSVYVQIILSRLNWVEWRVSIKNHIHYTINLDYTRSKNCVLKVNNNINFSVLSNSRWSFVRWWCFRDSSWLMFSYRYSLRSGSYIVAFYVDGIGC